MEFCNLMLLILLTNQIHLNVDEEQIGDLINDDIEEEGNSDDEEISGKRRRQDDDEEEEDLEDDDYALLEENLGYKVDRKKKLKRVKRFEDSDNEDEVTDERQAIANELFDGGRLYCLIINW